jgi:hypothetical protein
LTVDRVVEPLPLFTEPDTGGIAQRLPGNGRGRATEVVHRMTTYRSIDHYKRIAEYCI